MNNERNQTVPEKSITKKAKDRPLFILFSRITIGDFATLLTIASIFSAAISYIIVTTNELYIYKIDEAERGLLNDRARLHIEYVLRLENGQNGPVQSPERKQFETARNDGANDWVSAIWASRDNPDATKTICSLGQDGTREYVAKILDGQAR